MLFTILLGLNLSLAQVSTENKDATDSITSQTESDPLSAEKVDFVDIKSADWRRKSEQPITKRMLEHSDCTNKKLTIHYTGNGAEMNSSDTIKKLRGLFNFSTTEKKWGDIPYHYFLDHKSNLAKGRDTKYRPDTNTSYDTNCHLTIVVEGNDEKDPKKFVIFTPEMKSKLFSKMKELQSSFNIPTKEIGVHNDYANTSCPGNTIKSAVLEYKKNNPLGL